MTKAQEAEIHARLLVETEAAAKKDSPGKGGPSGPGGKGNKKPSKPKKRRRTAESRLPKYKFRGFGAATGYGSNSSTAKTTWSDSPAGKKYAEWDKWRKTDAALKGSRTRRAGLIFPVTQTQLELKLWSPRVGAAAGVYMAGVIEYLLAEVLELAGNAAKDFKGAKRIAPVHIMMGITSDEELNPFCSGTPGQKMAAAGDLVIRGAGSQRPPKIHDVLLKKKKGSKK